MASKQVDQRQRIAPAVFRKRFARHTADYVALRGKAALPCIFVGQGRQDLECHRILLVLRRGDDLFQRLLSQCAPRDAPYA
jgi:hypothetical protein